MKRSIIAALLVGTALSTPTAFAQHKFIGELAFTAGGNSANGAFDGGEGDEIFDNSNILGVHGFAGMYFPFSNTKLSGTVEAFARPGWDAINDDIFESTDVFNYGAAAHFNYRQPDRYMLGVVGSLWSNDVILPDESGDTESATLGLLGVEGKFFFPRASVGLQAGYIDTVDEAVFSDGGESAPDLAVSPFSEMTYVRLVTNYYLEDDLRLTGEAGFYDGKLALEEISGGEGAAFDATVTQFKLEMEQKIDSRYMVFGSFTNSNYENAGGLIGGVTENRFKIGLRIRLGEGDTSTLLSHEQTDSLRTPELDSIASVGFLSLLATSSGSGPLP